jgi:hypothetical protein
MVNDDPLQADVSIGVTVAAGLTVTATLNAAPAHAPAEVGVTLYVTVCGILVRLYSIPLIVVAPDPGAPPLNPGPIGANHEYVDPAGTIPFTTSAGVTLKAAPLQTVTGILFIAGLGLTVTVR